MAENITQALSAIKDAGRLTFTSLKTGLPALYLPQANSCSVEFTSDSVSAKAQGEDSVEFPLPSEGTMKISVDLINFDLLSLIMGSTLLQENVDCFVRQVEDITTPDEQVTLNDIPKGGEISVFTIRPDGSTHIKQLTEATCNESTVTCTGAVKGDTVAIYYTVEKQGKSFEITGTPENKEFYRVDGVFRMKSSETGADSFIYIDFKKVSVQNTISIEFDATTPSSFDINLKLLSDGNNRMAKWKYLSA